MYLKYLVCEPITRKQPMKTEKGTQNKTLNIPTQVHQHDNAQIRPCF